MNSYSDCSGFCLPVLSIIRFSSVFICDHLWFQMLFAFETTGSRLAVRTEKAAPAGDNRAPYFFSATDAGFSFPLIYAMAKLKFTAISIRIHII